MEHGIGPWRVRRSLDLFVSCRADTEQWAPACLVLQPLPSGTPDGSHFIAPAPGGTAFPTRQDALVAARQATAAGLEPEGVRWSAWHCDTTRPAPGGSDER